MILLTALLPVAILVYYIYHKDKESPEPTGQLVKTFFYGILSIPLSFCISIPFGFIVVYPTEASSILGKCQCYILWSCDTRRNRKIHYVVAIAAKKSLFR